MNSVYRCLLIGCVQYLYTIEHAVENIAYHICNSLISVLFIFMKDLFVLSQIGDDEIQETLEIYSI